MSEIDLVEKLDKADSRNAEILTLVAEGWPYSAIGQALGVTPETVSGVVMRHRDKAKQEKAS